MTLSRRSLIGSLIMLVAAPAIVRVSSLMPVKVMEQAPDFFLNGVPIYKDDLQVMPVYFQERMFWVTKAEPQIVQWSDNPLDFCKAFGRASV